MSATMAVVAPNALGPAELVMRYGTPAQKTHFLPRLAAGDEVPCLVLTGPEAGSNTAIGQSVGLVCEGSGKGRMF